MKLPKYNILEISARAILNTAKKTESGYRFYFDTNDETNQSAIKKTPQDDCALFHQLQPFLPLDGEPVLDSEDTFMTSLVWLDFSGIFDRRAVGRVKALQELAEYLFRPEGIEFVFYRGPVRFVAFERSASMSRKNKLSFIRADLFDSVWERITLGMKIGKCQLSKLYAYNGLMFTSGRAIEHGFSMDVEHIIVVDNPRSIVRDVAAVTVEDDGSDAPMRRYSRVEKTMDIEVLEFDGEGLISAELGQKLDPFGYEKHDHHSFQIRMPYIKGVVHEVDFHKLFVELGVREIVDIEGVRHPVSRVDMILTKSMCKGWSWMKENGLNWREYLDRCRKYNHLLFVSGMDRRSRDGLTELNFQLLNTAAITAEEYRPIDLPLGWERSPESVEQTWLTKATETAYYNTVADIGWQLFYFSIDLDNPELEYTDRRRMRAELLDKNPAFLGEQVFQKELADKAKHIREQYGIGKLMVRGDTRYLSDDLMRLLAVIARTTSEQACDKLIKESLTGSQVYAPQTNYASPEQLTILRNPHISRNEEALVTPLDPVGPLRKKYLNQLYYVAMVDSRSLIPDRLGGADYDGDTVHLYAEPLLSRCVSRNYDGRLDNASNLPLLKIPSAEPLIADANDWRARFETVKNTFSSRVGQISNAALRRSILAYDESLPVEEREQYRKETEILTILTGLEIDSAKSGVKPELSEYLGNHAAVKSNFLKYKGIVGDPDEHEWYEPSKAKRLKAYFAEVEWDEVTANLERTPFYAHELWKQTACIKSVRADSEALFTFAADPEWREKLDPQIVEHVRSIIADYEEAKRRCESYRHLKPSTSYRKDVQRILFSRDQEDEISVEDLYHGFERCSRREIHDTLEKLRQSDWQFTPEEDRLVALYELFTTSPPYCRDILCDFRCGGYRILGDILMDLDEQYRIAEIQKHKGINKNDSEQLRAMLQGAIGKADYQKQIIRNCIDILEPRHRFVGEAERPGISQETAVQCAELLGKRRFILEVLPAAALDLAVDFRKPGTKIRWDLKWLMR